MALPCCLPLTDLFVSFISFVLWNKRFANILSFSTNKKRTFSFGRIIRGRKIIEKRIKIETETKSVHNLLNMGGKAKQLHKFTQCRNKIRSISISNKIKNKLSYLHHRVANKCDKGRNFFEGSVSMILVNKLKLYRNTKWNCECHSHRMNDETERACTSWWARNWKFKSR